MGFLRKMKRKVRRMSASSEKRIRKPTLLLHLITTMVLPLRQTLLKVYVM